MENNQTGKKVVVIVAGVLVFVLVVTGVAMRIISYNRNKGHDFINGTKPEITMQVDKDMAYVVNEDGTKVEIEADAVDMIDQLLKESTADSIVNVTYVDPETKEVYGTTESGEQAVEAPPVEEPEAEVPEVPAAPVEPVPPAPATPVLPEPQAPTTMSDADDPFADIITLGSEIEVTEVSGGLSGNDGSVHSTVEFS